MNMNKKKIGFNLGSLKISANISNDKEKEPPGEQDSSNNPTQKSGFGSFGKIHNEVIEPPKIKNEDEIKVESNPDIAKIMGFSGFGDGKKAKNFDMAQIMEEAKRKAQERNFTNNLQLEQNYNDMQKRPLTRESA